MVNTIRSNASGSTSNIISSPELLKPFGMEGASKLIKPSNCFLFSRIYRICPQEINGGTRDGCGFTRAAKRNLVEFRILNHHPM